MHKMNYIKKNNNQNLMSSMIWNLKKWTNPWWVNNLNLLKISNKIRNSFNLKKRNKISQMSYIKTLSKPMLNQTISADQNINTINLKSNKFKSTEHYRPLICRNWKLLTTLMKLCRKGWTNPWWAISHKQVKSYEWINNNKIKRNKNNFTQVTFMNTISLQSLEYHK